MEGVIKATGEQWAKTDPTAVLQFASSKGGQLGSLLGTAALKGWAERNLNEAADWMTAADDSVRNRLGPGFVEAWAKKDAAGALALGGGELSRSRPGRGGEGGVQGGRQKASRGDGGFDCGYGAFACASRRCGCRRPPMVPDVRRHGWALR